MVYLIPELIIISSDFNFDVIYQEEKLQAHYEQLEEEEIESVRQRKQTEEEDEVKK